MNGKKHLFVILIIICILSSPQMGAGISIDTERSNIRTSEQTKKNDNIDPYSQVLENSKTEINLSSVEDSQVNRTLDTFVDDLFDIFNYTTSSQSLYLDESYRSIAIDQETLGVTDLFTGIYYLKMYRSTNNEKYLQSILDLLEIRNSSRLSNGLYYDFSESSGNAYKIDTLSNLGYILLAIEIDVILFFNPNVTLSTQYSDLKIESSITFDTLDTKLRNSTLDLYYSSAYLDSNGILINKSSTYPSSVNYFALYIYYQGVENDGDTYWFSKEFIFYDRMKKVISYYEKFGTEQVINVALSSINSTSPIYYLNDQIFMMLGIFARILSIDRLYGLEETWSIDEMNDLHQQLKNKMVDLLSNFQSNNGLFYQSITLNSIKETYDGTDNLFLGKTMFQILRYMYVRSAEFNITWSHDFSKSLLKTVYNLLGDVYDNFVDNSLIYSTMISISSVIVDTVPMLNTFVLYNNLFNLATDVFVGNIEISYNNITYLSNTTLEIYIKGNRTDLFTRTLDVPFEIDIIDLKIVLEDNNLQDTLIESFSFGKEFERIMYVDLNNVGMFLSNLTIFGGRLPIASSILAYDIYDQMNTKLLLENHEYLVGQDTHIKGSIIYTNSKNNSISNIAILTIESSLVNSSIQNIEDSVIFFSFDIEITEEANLTIIFDLKVPYFNEITIFENITLVFNQINPIITTEASYIQGTLRLEFSIIVLDFYHENIAEVIANFTINDEFYVFTSNIAGFIYVDVELNSYLDNSEILVVNLYKQFYETNTILVDISFEENNINLIHNPIDIKSKLNMNMESSLIPIDFFITDDYGQDIKGIMILENDNVNQSYQLPTSIEVEISSTEQISGSFFSNKGKILYAYISAPGFNDAYFKITISYENSLIEVVFILVILIIKFSINKLINYFKELVYKKRSKDDKKLDINDYIITLIKK